MTTEGQEPKPEKPKRRRKAGRPEGWGYKFQKNGIWWVKYHHRGVPHRETTRLRGPDGEAAADALLDKRYQEINGHRFIPGADKLFIQDLERLVLDDYELQGLKSSKRVGQSFRHLKDYFTYTPAPEIPRQMSAYMAMRKRAGAGDGTIAAELTAVRRGFTLAVRDGLLMNRPVFPTAPQASARQGFVEDQDMVKVVKALPEYLRPYVSFLYLTAWRRSEAAALLWAHVDLERGEIRLPGNLTKTGEPRVLPFGAHPRLDQLIRDQKAKTDEWQAARSEVVPLVFWRPTKHGARQVGDFRKSWADAAKAAGKPALLIHDLRRSRARLWSEAGVSESVAMQLGGWETNSVFKRYRIVPTSDMEAALRRTARAEGVRKAKA